MAVTSINSENHLVQATFAAHLEQDAGLGQRLRLEPGDIRPARHPEAASDTKEAVLTK